MIHYTTGNLLEAEAVALVNTVNTVGVMGKGIALMFKERFPKNMNEYSKACKAKEIEVGEVFATETNELMGPKWIVNFPTKKHWRHPSKMEWIEDGLKSLRQFIETENIKSIALPPLGAGNGKLNWADVKPIIETELSSLANVDIYIYEPTSKYQNVGKKEGVNKLTPSRAMITELIRRYLISGIDCTLLEVQKLAWFLEKAIERNANSNPLNLGFKANLYGPYSDRLMHLLNGLDGSFLKCDKRIRDATPMDLIWFNQSKLLELETYLNSSEMRPYLKSLEEASKIIDGFESPFGMELLATVDWLIQQDNVIPDTNNILHGIESWPESRGQYRKKNLFQETDVNIALSRLAT